MIVLKNSAGSKAITIEVAPNGDLIQKTFATARPTQARTRVIKAESMAGEMPEDIETITHWLT